MKLRRTVRKPILQLTPAEKVQWIADQMMSHIDTDGDAGPCTIADWAGYLGGVALEVKSLEDTLEFYASGRTEKVLV